MEGSIENTQAEQTSQKPGRLHYLDWLQVLAVLGVFLFHAIHPFSWKFTAADLKKRLEAVQEFSLQAGVTLKTYEIEV